MASSDGFTRFLLSIGNLEPGADLMARSPQDALFKVLDFCQSLQKKQLHLENCVTDLREENIRLRAQVEKLRFDVADRVSSAFDRKTAALVGRVQEVESIVEATRDRLDDMLTHDEVEVFVERESEKQLNKYNGILADKTKLFASSIDLDSVNERLNDLGDKFGKVSMRLEEWSRYRDLQKEIEIGQDIGHASRTPFSLLHLLHPSKSAPLTWNIKQFSKFKSLARENTCRRLYSRPFGIEKDGTIRCVLRVVVVWLPNEDILQFALEVLFATKYKRKFDFRFQILPSIEGKPVVKTFSSTEACVPRYWFPQNELQPSGLISFAFAVSEQQLKQDKLLVDDCLLIQVGLQE